jgi:hypothetical protein
VTDKEAYILEWVNASTMFQKELRDMAKYFFIKGYQVTGKLAANNPKIIQEEFKFYWRQFAERMGEMMDQDL